MHDQSEILVSDEIAACPYLAGREARMPLRFPVNGLSGDQLDRQLAEGDRRTGPLLYRTACPSCNACQPIRVPVRDFAPSRSQRRAMRRGDNAIKLRLRKPMADERRTELYNKHGTQRGLNARQGPVSIEHYREFLVASCCDSIEIDYLVDEELVAVAIADRGAKALSAVYCFFDPGYAHLSLGTYSILTQLRLARQWQMDYVYLGLYIAEAPHMNYKTAFRPHQLLVDGSWMTPAPKV